MKMSVGKLVIRGTSKMSLHDRFTQLDYQVMVLLLASPTKLVASGSQRIILE